ncbi:MAG: SH3 domain-containing protein [Anaerolineales bacterium]
MRKNKILFGLIVIALAAAFILEACQSATATVAPAPANTAASPTVINPTVPAVTPVAPTTLAPTVTEPATVASTLAAPTTIPATAPTVAQVVPSINANCRKGPGTGYFAITYLQNGTAYNVVGRNEINTWWLVQESPTTTCWMGDPNASLQGPTDQVPVELVPPLPGTPTSFGNTFICSSSNLEVSLQWAPVENATGYSIYLNGNHLVDVPANETSYVQTDAPQGASLVYELEAFNDYGASDSLSTTVAECN